MNPTQRTLCAGLLSLAALPGVAAAQQNVNFDANLASSCTLTLGNGGTMAADMTTGTTLSSDVSGGSAAQLVILYIGTAPTVTFGAPALVTAPGSWTDNSTKEIRYNSLGRSQAWTSAQTSFTQSLLTDTYVIHGRVSNAAGFAAGTYQLRTVVTCS